MYAGIKHSHMLLFVLSILLFQFRFFLKVSNRPFNRFLKISPHIIDTLLLASGIALAVLAGFVPWEQPWLGVKLIALVLYIGFGVVALKTEGTKSYLAYVAATISVVYMILVAFTKSPVLA